MIKVNFVAIALIAVAILVFIYYIFKRNRKDQKELENDLNEREIKTKKSDIDHT